MGRAMGRVGRSMGARPSSSRRFAPGTWSPPQRIIVEVRDAPPFWRAHLSTIVVAAGLVLLAVIVVSGGFR